MTITIQRHHQPNTSETWIIETSKPLVAKEGEPSYIKSRAANGWVEVTGRVINSTITGRLFHATNTKQMDDKPLRDSMPARYLVDGASYITIAS